MRDLRCGYLRAPDYERIDHRNSDAAAYVAQKIVKSRRIAQLFVAELSHGHGNERNEYKPDEKAAQDDGPDHEKPPDLNSGFAEPQRACSHAEKTRRNQPA